MQITPTLLLLREQAWFRGSLEVETLPPFPSDKKDVFLLDSVGSFRPRVVVGRGPVTLDISPELHAWFGPGDQLYPICQCPSIGPSGAGLMGRAGSRTIAAGGEESISLVEISIVQPVTPEVIAEIEKAEGNSSTTLDKLQDLQLKAKMWLEQAVGLYALYQYPIVWRLIDTSHFVGCADLRTNSVKPLTRVLMDNFIPLRLNAKEKLLDGNLLVDDALKDLAKLESGDMRLPLLFLQRSMWHSSVELRFLESFWILDYFTHKHKPTNQSQGGEELFKFIEEHVKRERPQDLRRVRALKGTFIQLPLKKRLADYLESIQVSCDELTVDRYVKLRNDLSHGGAVEKESLTGLELEIRSLIRKVVRRELEARGVVF